MDNGVQVCRTPSPVVLSPLDLCSMRPLEDAVASDVIPLLLNIRLHSSQHTWVIDACGLEQSGKVIDTEMPVRTSVRFATSRRMFRQDFLAGERGITPTTPNRIAPNVTVSVPNVVPIFFVECVISDKLEALTPEDKAVLEG